MSRPTKPYKVYLETDTAAMLELATMDPVSHKPRYGARSLLIERLIRRHLREIGFNVKSSPLTDEQINSIDSN